MITPRPIGAEGPERVSPPESPGAPRSPEGQPAAASAETLNVPEQDDHRTGSVAAVLPTATAAEISADALLGERKEIETILSEGLEEEFRSLDPSSRQRFRQEGERIASAIQTLLAGSKKAAKRIYALILQWLGMIPGINRYFLQQEAKIKTDRILSLRRP